jgi:hypothetical protein
VHRSVSPDQEGLHVGFPSDIVQNIQSFEKTQERNKLKIVYHRIESIGRTVLCASIVSFPLVGPVPRWNCTVPQLHRYVLAVPTYAVDSALHDIVYA